MVKVFTPSDVLAVIREHVPEPNVRRFVLAYSGGLDSTVLLHLLAGELQGWSKAKLHAVYVDHGLHEDSANWAGFCRKQCKKLDVSFETIRVDVHAAAGESLEANARSVRYQALAQLMTLDDVLVTAHHADDQAETVILQLLRGCGPPGLAAMPVCAEFGPGFHVRPLLDLDRQSLLTYAKTTQLEWLDDPSNMDTRFDRNFLRHELVPMLKDRWPAFEKSLGRSARLCAEASGLLEQLAQMDATGRWVGGTLECNRLDVFDPSRARNLIRFCLRQKALPLPSERQLKEIMFNVLGAGPDRTPRVSWEGGECRRFRDRLYLMRPLVVPDKAQWSWQPPDSVDLGVDMGVLSTAATQEGGLLPQCFDKPLHVRLRRGGERIRPVGSQHHRTLKNLFQEAGIVPWMRDRVPLVFSDDELLAVGDRWLCADYLSKPGEAGVEIVWERHPTLF